MGIKVAFFDLMGTLARYVPEQEDVLVQVCSEISILLDERTARRAFLKATLFWSQETATRPLDTRTPQEQRDLYLAYDQVLLKAAGIEVSDVEADKMFRRFMQLSKGGELRLYDDALPCLQELKDMGLTLGIISNMGKELDDVCRKLSLIPPMSIAISSQQVGTTKPEKGIFLAGLKAAEVGPDVAFYVGDQWDVDVIGAINVGMQAVLLDRYASYTDGQIQTIVTLQDLAEVIRSLV